MDETKGPLPGTQATSEREPRRPINRSAVIILPVGTSLPVELLDLSYNGCKLRLEAVLAVGTCVKLAVPPSLTHPAEVRWCQDGLAGLEFVVTKPKRKQDTRREVRRALRIEASVRRTGTRPFPTVVLDLTPTGCKVEFVERPSIDERVWIKFDGLEAMEATVRWVSDFIGGLEFVRPIHSAVFDLHLQRLLSSAPDNSPF